MYLKSFISMYIVGIFALLLSNHSSQAPVSVVTMILMIAVFFAGLHLSQKFKSDETLSKMMRTFYKTTPFSFPLIALFLRQVVM